MTENTRPTKTFDRDALMANARELVATLEAIHPDPYLARVESISTLGSNESYVTCPKPQRPRSSIDASRPWSPA